MMIGERNHGNPTVHVPPWTLAPYPTAGMILAAYPTALPRHLNDVDVESDCDRTGRESDLPVGVYSCDHFRMFEFKVRNCARGRSHDWTECPYAHPGEKARRRDPRKYRYSGTACTDFRKGYCRKGDACELAHGVFECWLHPDRYRTQPCKDGLNCARLVCFFAHAPDQLRVPSPRTFMSAPQSVSPMANSVSRSLGSNSIKEMVASLRQLQLNKVKASGYPLSMTRPGFCSLPSTPTRVGIRHGIGFMDLWDKDGDEEPVMERVESGRPLREKMFEKLSKDNPLHRVDPHPSDASNLDME